MDYVREELLRQRMALERLMTGGAEREPVPESQEDATRALTADEERAEAIRRVSRKGERRDTARRSRRAEHGQSNLPRSESRGAAEAEPLARWGERRAASASESIRIGARQVSRAIERDARRYDGGFTIC